MQYTSNYNLMLPEGTDAVNLLTQMNPNTSDIDTAMFANKQMSVGRATESTAGTVHAITRANQDSPIFAFTATSNWTKNDTMSVDGVSCTVYLTDGTQPDSGAYVINSEVLAIVQGSRVTVFVQSKPSLDASDISYGSGNVDDALDELFRNGRGTPIDIDIDHPSGNAYTTPTDGYVLVENAGDTSGTRIGAVIRGSVGTTMIVEAIYTDHGNESVAVYVKKGMRIHSILNGRLANTAVTFRPFA